MYNIADIPYAYRYLVNKDLKVVENWTIFLTLAENNWNRNAASRILGISRRTLWDRIERLKSVGFDVKPNKSEYGRKQVNQLQS